MTISRKAVLLRLAFLLFAVIWAQGARATLDMAVPIGSTWYYGNSLPLTAIGPMGVDPTIWTDPVDDVSVEIPDFQDIHLFSIDYSETGIEITVLNDFDVADFVFNGLQFLFTDYILEQVVVDPATVDWWEGAPVNQKLIVESRVLWLNFCPGCMGGVPPGTPSGLSFSTGDVIKLNMFGRVPSPSTALLMLAGCLGIVLRRR